MARHFFTSLKRSTDHNRSLAQPAGHEEAGPWTQPATPPPGTKRPSRSLDPGPVAAYHQSGYAEKIIAGRVGGTPASWGS